MKQRLSKEKVNVRLFSGLGRTLTISFLMFALIPIAVISVISYNNAHNSLDHKIRNGLKNAAQAKTREIGAYFDRMRAELRFQSEIAVNAKLLEELIDARETSGKPLAEFVKSFKWATVVDTVAGEIEHIRNSFDFYDVYLIDNYGDILFSVAREVDLGTNLFIDGNSSSKFAEAFRRSLETGKLSFSDYEHYAPSNNQISGFLTAVVVNEEGDRIGVLAFQFLGEPISRIMENTVSRSRTMETYLIGPDLTLRSELVLDKEKSLLDEQILTQQTLRIKQHFEEGHTHEEMSEKVTIYKGPHGKAVLGIHHGFPIENVVFGVIAEIEEEEAFASVYGLRNLTLTLFGLTGLLVFVFVMIIVRRIIKPIIQLSSGAKRVATGDYSQLTDIRTKNEIGELGHSFNSMVETLSKNREENHLREWFQAGQMELNDILRGNQDLPELCSKITAFLAKYLVAEIGTLYTINNEGRLKLTGSYAFSSPEQLSREFEIGQGLVGQAALDKKQLLLNHIPDDYLSIQSGIGETVPRSIVVKPFVLDHTVLGVIELGALEPFSNEALEFLNVVSESIAVGIQTILGHVRVQELLEQSQVQTEELRASEEQLQTQQEELRQTNEELQEYTDALKKSEKRLKEQQEDLQQFNEELEEKTERLEDQKSEIEHKNTELEQARNVIEEKAKDLELSSKYKSEFLANMSHELRTPLNSILLLSKLFYDNKDGSLNEDQIESAEAIHSSGNDLLILINEILDLSKIESGKMDLNPEVVNITPFAEALSDSFKHFANEKGLTLATDLADNLPQQITTDQQRLEQIIKNFFSNAFKFTSEGQVTFKVSSPKPEEYQDLYLQTTHIPENAVAFSIIDTGIGIPKDKQKLIFEAFQQADGSTSRQFGGTGLGLSISRELAKKLGGAIRLESEEGQGSTFTLYIPHHLPSTNTATTSGIQSPSASSQPTQQAILAKPEESHKETLVSTETPRTIIDDRKVISPADKSILIIEDDPTFSKILCSTSREQGFKCLVAHDGETGLQFADYYLPSAIILDIGLPGIDGWTVMARLKESASTRHIPVHFISAADKEKEALDMGAVDFLTKPVTSTILEQAFENINRIISKKVKDLLIIEDNQQQVKAISKLIGNGDVSINSVDNAKDGFKEIQSGKYDCVILDLKLPDMSGIQLLSKIREQESFRHLPIIVYTGKELTTKEINIINQYADTTITKGVNSHKRLLDETTLFLHRVEKNLPAHQQKQIRMLHDKEAVLEGKTILVVDDDMRNVFSIKKILEENQMHVIVGKNGREGVEKLQQHKDHVDLVLMDIMMPEMDGYEAMRIIKKEKQFAKLPIIALTAKAMKGDKAKCIEAGANDYLAKPLDVDRLLSMFRVWLYE